MAGRLFDVRSDERRPVALAFSALLGITAAHTLIETARDALFLAKVPVTHLPALYVAIAALGVATTRIGARLEGRAPHRAGERLVDPVAAAPAGAALVTVAFWAATAGGHRAVLYALYIYSGMFASWVAGRLWIRLGDVFTVGQAKRLYGLVGTGGVLGAVVGAGVARGLLPVVGVRHLLLVGAAALLVTAAGPVRLLTRLRPGAPAPRAAAEPAPAGLAGAAREIARHPYLSRVAAIVMLAACAGTAIDFSFKREVAAAITQPERLAATLATVSLATNVLSLLAQSVGVGVAVRLLGVHRALYVMPLLLAASAGGAVAGLGLGAALALRGTDGTLRHSLHKTTTELLFVPLPDALRARAKPIVDLVGQRGGQALASVALFALASALPNHAGIAVGALLVAICVAWVAVAHGVRARYLDVFRATLRRGREELPLDLPALDMSALEALIAALSSKKDAEVLGALDLLAAQERGRLIPSLVLFHPSKPIVLHALDLLVREGRTDFVPVADRLLTHPDPEVRAAALRARTAVEPDPGVLRELLADSEDELRATALVLLVARGEAEPETLAAFRAGSPGVRRALARALGQIPAGDSDRRPLVDLACSLLDDADVEARGLAAAALGRLRAVVAAPRLVALLADRSAGLAAIDALSDLGDAALPAIEASLDADDVAPEVRWRLVRALARSGSARAVAILAERVVATTDTALRTRILRALCTVQAGGTAVPIAREALVGIAEQSVAAATRALALRVAHAALGDGRSDLATPGASLLQQLLRDKEIEAQDRLFLTLSLLHPDERFARIQRGLESANAKARASSRELIENVVAAPLRDAVLALTDEGPDDARLARLGGRRDEASYVELVAAMIAQGGEVCALATYHARELGVPPELAALAPPAEPSSADLERELSGRDLPHPKSSSVAVEGPR